MLTPALDSNAKEPLYEQLYRFLRREIETGHIPAGERLPSKRKLASDAHLSVVTVETAYSQLVAEGYLRSEDRRGFFVQQAASRPEQAQPLPQPLPASPAKPSCPYDFATNAVDAEFFPFSTWAKLTREVLSSRDSALLSAAHPQGVPELRQAIVSRLYHFRGIQVQPEQIVVGAGSEYLLSLLVQLLGREGGYAVEDPGYQKTEQILSHSGAQVYPIPVDEQGLRVDLLEQSGARVVHVTPSHHFPLSLVMPVTRRRALLDWAAARPDRYIIEDDYDSEFRLSGRPIPALQGLDRDERVVYLNTFTKSLAPSMRISYMVLPAQLARRYQQEFFFYSSTVPSFEQYTLALFMDRGHLERHIWRTRKNYKLRRDALLNAAKSEGLTQFSDFSGGEAGLHLLLKVRARLTEQQLVDAAESVGVRVYPLRQFYRLPVPQSYTPTFVMGYARMREEEITEAVHRLVIAWETH
ncbi:MAG: PLP-dependent aminotransferase family protein [Clostridiales bacterium]|nr:PLP-dependent aminotransferase family protein [Clostridiales bacterium]